MAWYDSNWTRRFKITSDQTKVDEAVDNLFYDLANAPAGFWAAVKSDGGDIRVTQSDEVTEVAREVSGFNLGSQLGSLFFKATGLSASVNTDFYIYYGNASASEPAAGSTFGKNNVWTSYLAVWHFDEASGNLVDSKGGLSAAPSGITYGATGKLRSGVDDNGTLNVNYGNVLPITAASLTFTAWINPPTIPQTFTALFRKTDGDSTDGYGWLISNAGAENRNRLLIGTAVTSDSAFSDAGFISTGSMHWYAVTYDGANARHYKDGSLHSGPYAFTLVPTNAGASFELFRDWDGIADEFRISTSVRSANWLSTEYQNQNSPSTFWTTAAQESLVTTLSLSSVVAERRPRPFAPGIAR